LPILPPSPWKEFLQSLDEKMTGVCTLPCFGGFAITLEYGISRSTADIDVLDVAPPSAIRTLMCEGGKGSPLAIEHQVYLDIVGIANPPYDIALTKLKRDSDKDFQDILQLAERIPFDLALLEKRYIEELRDNTTGNVKDNDFTFYRWKEAILESREKAK